MKINIPFSNDILQHFFRFAIELLCQIFVFLAQRLGAKRRTIMTELADRSSDIHLTEPIENNTTDECIEEIESDDSASKKSDSSASCSGSWSIDESVEFIQTSQKPPFDELPAFSIGTISPSGRSLSPIFNEPISLFNLSISPISSVEDLTHVDDQSVICSSNTNIVNGKYTEEWTKNGYSIEDDYPEKERISLDEIHAQINTPPSALSKSNKRLNLETIFEDVFFETPKKKRFNGIKRFNSWRIETFQEITSDERISSYVFEQQQSNKSDENPCSEATNILCDEFDEKINL